MNNLHTIEFNKYISPKVEPSIGTQWTLNGANNSFFKYIKDCYNGSPTNASIINAVTNYIYGEGLTSNLAEDRIKNYISRKDLKLMVLDFKLYGGFAYQVLWNSDERNKKPVKIKYVSVTRLGLNIDRETNVINGYWYSFDWEKSNIYTPKFYPKFDGIYKTDADGNGYDVELVVVNRTSSEPFFANPDYLPALQYCELEMELSNSSINHIKNDFQASKIVNVPFKPETEELEEEYAEKIKKNLTGSGKKNSIIIAFNETAEHKITVEPIEITELNQQYVHFEQVAQSKIIVGHSAPPILFEGSVGGTGFSNNADEIEMATKMLYRKQINPMREDIIDGLNIAFEHINSDIELQFKDFEDFNKDKREDI